MKNYYLGIDIGGTNIKTVVLNEEASVLERNEFTTDDSPGREGLWKKKISTVIGELSQRYTPSNPENLICGISAPGLVDITNSMTVHMPERLQGIENYNWSVELSRNIKVINDGHSACLAEYELFYRDQGVQHLLMITLGTGVGGGCIINGELYQGNLQRAGHVGHMTVNLNGSPTMTNMPGSLEYAIGNFSVADRTEGSFQSVRELVEAYKKGVPKATDWWLDSVRKLAVALASLTNILSPERIILGGGISTGAGEALMTPLREYMTEYEWRPGGYKTELSVAKLGEYAGAIGAAYFIKKTS